MRLSRHLLQTVGLLVAAALPAQAPQISFEPVESLMERWIDGDRVAGVVAIVEYDGHRLYEEVGGMRNIEAETVMLENTIFRIYSMSKPITCVAALVLVDDGLLDLDAPVSRYLPELANLEVGMEEKDQEGNTVLRRVPAEREMTVRDLMRHTSGLTYGLFGESLVEKMVGAAKVLNPTHDLQRMVELIAELPLKHQPGTTFEYGLSIDVLGRVIEVVAKKPLDEFMRERVFEPLKMVDTGFAIAKDDVVRLATVYQWGRRGLEEFAGARAQDPTRKPMLLSGGGGLFSTAADYLRFCYMILNDGELDGQRVLSKEAVAQLRSNQLDGQRLSGVAAVAAQDGFGLGGAVVDTDKAQADGPGAGSYSWAGAAGTYFWVDPKNRVVGLFMIQKWMDLSHGGMFQQAVYESFTQ